MDILELCHWRYATKMMLPDAKVPEQSVAHILETIRMAPSSSGLQPFQVFVITNPDIRTRIRAVAKNQAQITDCSHLLVFAGWDNYTEARINEVFDNTNRIRGVATERWENYRQMLLANYPPRGPEINFNHIARQVYVALSFAVMAAAGEQVDCTPIEGFDPAAVDDILGLDAMGLRSVVMLPLGYRDIERDWLVNMKKARRDAADLFTRID